MTVEFAVALPVLAVLLVSLVAGVLLADRAGRLQIAAATAARALGRDDDAAAAAAFSAAPAGAARDVRRVDGLVCVELTGAGSGPFAAVPVRGRGCAAEGGR